MSKRAICDNESCGRASDLNSPYQTIPDGWYSLTLGDRITGKDVCSLGCLERIVMAERATVERLATERVPLAVPPAVPADTDLPF